MSVDESSDNGSSNTEEEEEDANDDDGKLRILLGMDTFVKSTENQNTHAVGLCSNKTLSCHALMRASSLLKGLLRVALW